MRRLIYAVADAVGLLACALRLRAGVALANLARAGFRGAQARRILRSASRNFARSLADFFFPPPIRWDGLARLDALRAGGRGVLVLTGHVGAFDLLACEIARRGVPLHVVSRRLRAAWLDRFWWQRRARAGVRLHDARGSAAALVSALRRGEVVALVLDQHAPPPDGAPLPFFGEPAYTSLALARMSRAASVPVLPAFLLRGRRGLELVVDPHIQPESDRFAATRRYNEVLERIIRRHPDQWFWWHRRWKVVGHQARTAPASAASKAADHT